jgi:hypothetical protein
MRVTFYKLPKDCYASRAVRDDGVTVQMPSGHPRYDARERSKQAEKAVAKTGTNAEILVGVMHRIAIRRLDQHWPAADNLLREEWRCGAAACRPLVMNDVRATCDEIRAAAVQWSKLTVGDGLTFEWPHRTKEHRQHHRRRRAS